MRRRRSSVRPPGCRRSLPGSTVSVIRSSDALLVGDGGDALGHADAEVDDGVRLQLHRGAPRDDLARVELHRRQRPSQGRGSHRRRRGCTVSAKVCRWCSGFAATTTQSTRMPGTLTWRGSAVRAVGDALDLGDDDAAGVASPPWRWRGPRGSAASRSMVMLPLGIGGGAADDADIDWTSPCRTAHSSPPHGDEFDEVLGGARVDLAAAEAGVDERAEADPGQVAGAAGGDVAKQMRDDALRQVVGLDLTGDGQLPAVRGTRPQWPPIDPRRPCPGGRGG